MLEMTWRKTYRLEWQRRRELDFLLILEGEPGFPRVINWDAEGVDLAHCGISVKEALRQGLTTLDEIRKQLVYRLGSLKRVGIRHRDITENNLLWKADENLLYLIDFGWSCWDDEQDTPIPVDDTMRHWFCDTPDEEQAERTLRVLEEAA